jgi:hypothetical protein
VASHELVARRAVATQLPAPGELRDV